MAQVASSDAATSVVTHASTPDTVVDDGGKDTSIASLAKDGSELTRHDDTLNTDGHSMLADKEITLNATSVSETDLNSSSAKQVVESIEMNVDSREAEPKTTPDLRSSQFTQQTSDTSELKLLPDTANTTSTTNEHPKDALDSNPTSISVAEKPIDTTMPLSTPSHSKPQPPSISTEQFDKHRTDVVDPSQPWKESVPEPSQDHSANPVPKTESPIGTNEPKPSSGQQQSQSNDSKIPSTDTPLETHQSPPRQKEDQSKSNTSDVPRVGQLSLSVNDKGAQQNQPPSAASPSQQKSSVPILGKSVPSGPSSSEPQPSRDAGQPALPQNSSGDPNNNQRYNFGPIPRNLPKTAKNRPKNARVFVGNLASEFTNVNEMTSIFYKYGELIEEPVLRRSFGFIQYASAESASRAVDAEQGRIIGGIAIDLSIADNREVKRGTHIVNNTPYPHGPKGKSGQSLGTSGSGGPHNRGRGRDRDGGPHSQMQPARKRRRSLSPSSAARKGGVHPPQFRRQRPEPRSGIHLRILCMSPTARNYARQCEQMFRNATGLNVEILFIVAASLGEALGRAMREMIPYVMVVASKDVEDGTCTIRTLEKTGYEKAGRGNGIISLREAIEVCMIDRGMVPPMNMRGQQPMPGGNMGAPPAMAHPVPPGPGGPPDMSMPHAPWPQGPAPMGGPVGMGVGPGRKPGWMSGPRPQPHGQHARMPMSQGPPQAMGSGHPPPPSVHGPPPHGMPQHQPPGRGDSRPQYDRMEGNRPGYSSMPPQQVQEYGGSSYGGPQAPQGMHLDNRMPGYGSGTTPMDRMQGSDYGQGRYVGHPPNMGPGPRGGPPPMRDMEYDPAAVMPGGRPESGYDGWNSGEGGYGRNMGGYGMGRSGAVGRGRENGPPSGARHGNGGNNNSGPYDMGAPSYRPDSSGGYGAGGNPEQGYAPRPGSYSSGRYGYEADNGRPYDAARGGRPDWNQSSGAAYDGRMQPGSSMPMDGGLRYGAPQRNAGHNAPQSTASNAGQSASQHPPHDGGSMPRRDSAAVGPGYASDPHDGNVGDWGTRRNNGPSNENSLRRESAPGHGYMGGNAPPRDSSGPHSSMVGSRPGLAPSGYADGGQGGASTSGVNAAASSGASGGAPSTATGGVDIGKLTNLISAFQQQVQQGNAQSTSGVRNNSRPNAARGSAANAMSVSSGVSSLLAAPAVQQALQNVNSAPPRSQAAQNHAHQVPPQQQQFLAPQQGYGAQNVQQQHGMYPTQQRNYYGR